MISVPSKAVGTSALRPAAIVSHLSSLQQAMDSKQHLSSPLPEKKKFETANENLTGRRKQDRDGNVLTGAATTRKKSLPEGSTEATSDSGNSSLTTVMDKQEIKQKNALKQTSSFDSTSCDNSVFSDDEEDQAVGTKFRAIKQESSKPHHMVKVVAETTVAPPGKSRLLLRNIVMFLLIANACLWVFYSLEGSLFVIYNYQSMYYSQNVWTAINALCRPLALFFRMHSAACLFEIWSFS